MKNIKGKKGAIAGVISDFWAYVIFVFIIIIFLVFFKMQSGKIIENKITGLGNKIDENTILLNYLRTPVEIDIDGKKQTVNIADLIRLWYLNHDKYNNLLAEKTQKTLNLWEYQMQNPYSNNIIVKTFNIIIMEEKPDGDSINPLSQFKSKNYNIPDTGVGRLNLGQISIPISSSKSLYIILRSGFVDKSVAK